jgi:predicted ATPase
MIKGIAITRFFSFGERQTIMLSPDTNILVGINGTGKSNFLKTLLFLYESVVGEGMEKLFSEKWGGFSSVVNFSDSKTERIEIVYEFEKEKLKELYEDGYNFENNPSYLITIAKQGIANYVITEALGYVFPTADLNKYYLASTDENWTALSKEAFLVNKNSFRKYKIPSEKFNSKELILRQLSDPTQYPALHTIKRAIEQIKVYNYFDTTQNSIVRQLSPYYSALYLLQDGRNITHLLNYLSNQEIPAYKQIMELLRKHINPNFEDLGFMVMGNGKILLTLKEKYLEKSITIDHISDGTLRFLLLLAILYNPNRGKVICIDEPEIGLHPDMIKTIAEGIKYAAKTGSQMIIATHSPLLLNYFELEDLQIFEKDEKNQSIVIRKSEEDFKGWEGEFLVGQMWLSGQIGGVRW